MLRPHTNPAHLVNIACLMTRRPSGFGRAFHPGIFAEDFCRLSLLLPLFGFVLLPVPVLTPLVMRNGARTAGHFC